MIPSCWVILKTAMKEIFDMNVNGGNALSLDNRIDMLNGDQRRYLIK